MPTTISQLLVEIGADIKPLKEGMQQAKQHIEESKSSWGGLVEGIGKFAAVGAVAGVASLAALGAGAMYFANYGKEAEDSEQKLGAAVALTGKKTGVTTAQLDALTEALIKKVPVDDQAIRATEALTARYDNIGKTVFPRAISTALDLSQATGKSLTASTKQLDIALQDPIKSFGKLHGLGVDLTKQQQNQIKAWQNSGDIVKAQNFILDQLAQRYGGAAEAAGKTFGGQLTILNTQLDNVKQTIGMAILPVMEKFVGAVIPLVSAFADKLPLALGIATKALQGPLGIALKFVQTLIGNIPALLEALKNAFMAAFSDSNGQKLKALQTGLGAVGEVLKTVAGMLVSILGPALAGAGFLLGGIINIVALLIIGIQKVQPTVTAIAGVIVAKFNDIKTGIVDAINTARAIVVTALNLIQTTTSNVIQGTIKTWNDWKGVIGVVVGVLAVIFGPTLIQIGAQAVATGAQIAASFIASLARSAAQAIYAAGVWLTTTIPALIATSQQFIITSAQGVAGFVTGMIRTGIESAKSAATMLSQLIPALVATSTQFVKTAAQGVWSGITALAQFAIKGYAAAAAMLTSVIPAVLSTMAGFVSMAITGIASAIAGFIAYIPIALSAAAATLAATWPILAVIAAIALLVVGIKLAVEHWTQIKEAVGKAVDFIKGAVVSGFNIVKDTLGNIFGGLVNMAMDFGKNLVQKIIDGITGMKSAFTDGLKTLVGDAAKAVPGLQFALDHLPHFADGGTMQNSGLALVGEYGPELVKLPGGSQVYNNTQTQQVLSDKGKSGGDTHKHYHVTVQGTDNVAKVTQQALDTLHWAALIHG